MLARYCAYVHIAAYFRVSNRDPELNRRIEKVFASNSLFSYVRLGADIAAYLTRQSDERLAAFRDFFRTANPLPDEEQIAETGDADEFDIGNIYTFAEFPQKMTRAEVIADLDNARIWCEGVREFLAESLAMPCFANAGLVACAAGQRMALTSANATEWGAAPLWSDSRLLFCTDGCEWPLDPFIVMRRIGSSNVICFLDGQTADALRYTSIFIDGHPQTVDAPRRVEFPWASLVVQRIVPAIVYIGEEHVVKLRLANHGTVPVHVLGIRDRLPENVAAADGGPLGEVADVLVPPNGERTVQYRVRGREAGQRQYPANQVVTFIHDSEPDKVIVEGDDHVHVKTLPSPQVEIVREFFTPDGTLQPRPVIRQDDEFKVRYTISSQGARTDMLRITDRVSGARIISGDARLFEGVLERCDLQKPIQVEYRLYVDGQKRLDITTKVDKCATRGQLRGHYPIQDVGAPSLQLRWARVEAGVEAASRPELRMVMEVRNVGPSRAHKVRARPQGPPGVIIRCQDPEDAICIGVDQRVERSFCVALPTWGADGPATGSNAEFILHYVSVTGETFEAHLPLCLGHILQEELANIPLIGREEVQAKIKDYLVRGGTSLLGLHGQRGVGMRFLVERLAGEHAARYGRQARKEVIDCLNVRSFVEVISQILERIVYGDLPAESRGNRDAMRSFLDEIGMPPDKYLQPVEDLEILLNRRERASEGTWHWVAHLLRLFTKSRHIDPLVLLLANVDRFGAKELQDLNRLHREVAELPVRIVATSRHPLAALGVEAIDVPVSAFSLAQCREFVKSVFVYPPPSDLLVQMIYERTGGVPAAMTVLLKNLIKDRDRILSFGHPLGVIVRDHTEFARLPDSLEAVFRQDLLACKVRVAPELLAGLVVLNEPVSLDTLATLLARMNVHPGTPKLHSQMTQLVNTGWVQRVGGDAFQIARTSQRMAIERYLNATASDLWPQVHQAVYRKFRSEDRELETCLEQLIEGPSDLLHEDQASLMEGLRLLASRGCFSLLRKCLDKCRDKIDSRYQDQLRLCRIELDWLERGEFDASSAEQLRGRLATVRPRAMRRELQLRLALLEADWRRQKAGGAAAALDVLRRCEWRFLGVRYVGVKDAELRFGYDLALWKLCYQTRLEQEFIRRDDRLWRDLARANDRCVVQFLGAFLDLHAMFDNEMRRRESCKDPNTPVTVSSVLRPSRIAQLTELRRIEESFLAEYLHEPAKRNVKSHLLLGRLYLTAGLALWRSLTEEQKYADELSPMPPAADGPAEAFGSIHGKYLVPAASLFAGIGAELDLARADYQIALTHVELIRLAEKRSDRPRLDRLFPFVHGYLRGAVIPRFEKLGAVREADDAYQTWADCMLRWVKHSGEKIPEAIAALRETLARPAMEAAVEVRQRLQLELACLHLSHDDWQPAGAALDEVAAVSDDVTVLRAYVRLKRLESGQMRITLEDREIYEADLWCLEQYVAKRADSVLGPILRHGDIRVDAREALRGLLWHVVECCIEHEEGSLGLTRLRQWWKNAEDGPAASAEQRSRAVEALPTLWHLSGAAPLEILADFRAFALPAFEQLGHACLVSVIDRVSHFDASVEMRLLLAERLCKEGRPADAESVVDAVFEALDAQASASPNCAPAELLGRALATLLYLERSTGDAPRYAKRLTQTQTRLRNAKLCDEYLALLIELITTIEGNYEETKDDWYHEHSLELVVALKEAQEQCHDVLPVIHRLVNLYLQLPGRRTDAVELLERECEELLSQKDYRKLARYLSFLRDLIHSLRSVAETEVGDDRSMPEGAAQDASDDTRQAQQHVRDAARGLCIQIVERLGSEVLDFQTVSSVLSYTTALLEGGEAADIRTAVHVKLYQTDSTIDGTKVWAILGLWSENPEGKVGLELFEQVALASLANYEAEGLDGQPARISILNVRNYLINTRWRNQMLWAYGNSDRPETVPHTISCEKLICYYLESVRNGVLETLLESLPRYLAGLDDLERTDLVTFLYGYLFPDANLPLWKKMEQLMQCAPGLKREVRNYQESLIQTADGLGVAPQQAIDYARRCTERVLLQDRAHGKRIMEQLASCIRVTPLRDILQELSHYLQTKQRTVDYNSVLELWDDEVIASSDTVGEETKRSITADQ
jgi:hypothetical protein